MPGKLRILLSICLAAFLLSDFLLACTPSATEEPAPATGKADLPIEVMDQTGRLVKVSEMPEKIISLAPSNTEILYALGLEDKLVGVTEYCDYPEAAKQKPQIGGFSTVDIERVVDIEPDLILATNIHKKEVIPQLERLGLTVLALDPKTIDEVLVAISLIGQCTGRNEAASQLVTEMQNRIKVVTDKTAALPEAQRPKVFYITWHDPLMTPGSETRHNELIVKAGGTNIARELTGYAGISLEAVIQANPEVLIAGVGMGTGKELPFQFVKTEPRLENTDARRNHRVYKIDVDLAGRPGPRIVDALEKFAEFIHPELFKET